MKKHRTGDTRREHAKGRRKNDLDYRIIFNAASNGMAFTDAESGRIIDVNNAWLAATGFAHEDVIGKTALELGLWPSLDKRLACFAELQKKGGLVDFESDFILKSVETPHLISARFVEMNEKRYILWEFRNISRQKQSEEKLKWFNDLMKYVISHAQGAIAVHDRGLKYIYVSDNYLRQYNVKEKDVIGKYHYDVFPDLPQKWRDVHQRVLKGSVESGDRDPYVRADGSVEWTRWECRPWHEYDGSIGGLIVYTEVITERVRREEALRESEERLRLAVRAGNVGIWEWDIATDSLQWNDQLKAIFGLPPDTTGLTLEKFTSAIYPDDLADTENSFRTALARHTEFNREYRIIHPDRSVHWIVAIGRGIYDPEGNPLRMLGCALDITERVRAEQALKESEKKYRFLVETTKTGFVITDEEGRVIDANDEYVRMSGHTMKVGIVGRKVTEWTAEYDLARNAEEVRKCTELGYVRNLEIDYVDRRGNVTPVEINANVLQTSEGQQIFTICRDISERRALNEERLRSVKLESIGTLAGGIAHDFNNLLQGIFGYISMARMSLDRPEKANDMLLHTESALHTAVNLTTQLLTFAKGGKPMKKILRLTAVVENSLRFSLSGSTSSFNLSVADDLWFVEADEGQLSQVIQNIVLNASEAMAESGTVYVSLSNVAPSSGEARGLPKGDRFIRMDFRDTGIGIPAENISRIFDPYFTTKQRGSGLGLATSYSIIRNHGGIIEVKSELSKGSTFSIFLPAAKETETAKGPLPSQSRFSRKCRVLLMDDEQMIRNVAKAMTEGLGHEIECANDGMAAVEAYRKAKDAGSPFDIVILDLTVKGGMGGEYAIRMLKEIDPGVVAVVSSGYADSAIMAKYKEYGFAAFLNKPYTLDKLGNCINSLMNPA